MQISSFYWKELEGLAKIGLHSHLATLVGRIIDPPAPQRCPLSNPQNLWLRMFWEKGFADVIKVKILRWDNSGFSGWAQCNHKGSYKWKRKASGSESGKQRAEAEVRVMWLLAFKMEESNESGIRAASRRWEKWGTDSSLESLGGNPANILSLAR